MNIVKFKEVRQEIEDAADLLANSELSTLEYDDVFRVLEVIFELGYTEGSKLIYEECYEKE